MTLRQLEYFVAVCEHGSFSEASKNLYVTQPTISIAITTLENEFKVPLFNRNKNVITVTEEGKFLYERSKTILKSVNNLSQDMTDLSENSFTIRVGVPPMIGSFLFPTIYKEYLAIKPTAKFDILEDGSLGIRSKIMSQDLDIGFSIVNNYVGYYNTLILLETELIYCVSKDNPLASKEALDIDDIKNEKIMLMREGSYKNFLINNIFNKVDLQPNITLISSQLSVLKEFIKMDSAGAFLIKELVDPSDDSIVGIPFKEKLDIKIGLIWSKETVLHNEAIKFIEFIAEHKAIKKINNV